jgi:hypothetical protein
VGILPSRPGPWSIAASGRAGRAGTCDSCSPKGLQFTKASFVAQDAEMRRMGHVVDEDEGDDGDGEDEGEVAGGGAAS